MDNGLFCYPRFFCPFIGLVFHTMSSAPVVVLLPHLLIMSSFDFSIFRARTSVCCGWRVAHFFSNLITIKLPIVICDGHSELLFVSFWLWHTEVFKFPSMNDFSFRILQSYCWAILLLFPVTLTHRLGFKIKRSIGCRSRVYQSLISKRWNFFSHFSHCSCFYQ